jgi:hypothetical protein
MERAHYVTTTTTNTDDNVCTYFGYILGPTKLHTPERTGATSDSPAKYIAYERVARIAWDFPSGAPGGWECWELALSPWSLILPSPHLDRTLNRPICCHHLRYTSPTPANIATPKLYSIAASGSRPLLELRHYITLSTPVFIPIPPCLR